MIYPPLHKVLDEIVSESIEETFKLFFKGKGRRICLQIINGTRKAGGEAVMCFK
jgi:hypothetical protein